MNLYFNSVLNNLIWRYVLRNPRLRLRLTRLFVADRDSTVDIFGSPLYINSIKEIGYRNAAKNAQSNVVSRDEAASIINLALLLAPGDTFVDIGANVGLYSTILGRVRHLYPSVRCYAFEANPDTFTRLSKTLEGTSTALECVALSDRSGRLQCYGGAVSGAFGAVGMAMQPKFQIQDHAIEVPAKRLDECAISGDSIVLKIDVEGFEWEVLQGASRLLAANRIKAVYFDGFRNQEIPAYMRSHGFECFDGRTLRQPPQQTFSHLWVKREALNGLRP